MTKAPKAPAAPKAQRINARLPPDAARKVAYLQRQTHGSTTQVLLESIDHYYAATVLAREHAGSAAQRLQDAGFIGCASGTASLSSSYKDELSRSLSDKT